MENSALESPKTEARIPVKELKALADDWVLEGELQQLSPNTITERRFMFGKFFWFIDREGIPAVGIRELKRFFQHLAQGHTEPGGRFGNPKLTKPLRPVSIKGWHTVMAAWFRWMVVQEYTPANLMLKVPAPFVRDEVKQPLNSEQAQRLLAAARRSNSPLRDEALLLFLMDTGIRASELCSLKVGDVDLHSRTFRVVGKGNKIRQGYLGRAATRALNAYLRSESPKREDYLFQSQRGCCGGIGEPLTRNGVRQLVHRLARAARIETPCGPHTLRRVMAVEFLRGGGNVFALQNLLGHSDLTMTRKYCAIAEADIENQHRLYSPADRLKL